MIVERRKVLIGGLSGLVSLAAMNPSARAAALAGARSGTRSTALDAHTLSFYHLHTAETLSVTYRENGVLVPDAVAAITHLLRDFRTDEAHEIDVALLDTLSLLHEAAGRRGHFEIISGFRSPRTNAALRKVTDGVAEGSLHMSGRAIDVRSTGIATKDLRAAALELKRGGVGYYPSSNFVHLDTGAFRAW
jgi:uncharacterized protein YcbK (DUF882 family)